MKRVHQEFDGNSTNIILPDADLREAITRGLQSVLSNSGQTCDSPQRILVHKDQYEEAKSISREMVPKTAVGDPSEQGADLGPLASEEHFKKVQILIQKALKKGLNESLAVLVAQKG